MITVGTRQIQIEGRLLRLGRLDADKYHFLDDPPAFLDELRKCGKRVDLFTFLQRLPDTTPRFSYPMEWDNLAVLPVSTFDHWWNKQISAKTRNRVRKAEKEGITVRELPFNESLLRAMCEVYAECPIRQGKPFIHYRMSLERMRQYAGTYLSDSFFAGAFLGGTMIGFTKITLDEARTQASIMHIVSMVRHRDKAPTNALVAQAVRSCSDRKIPHLVYSNFAYGNKQSDSLSDFKERNAFQRVNVPRYYAPLTSWGWAGFNMGLHHRMNDYLPESVLATLRQWRTNWYSRKFQVAQEAS